MANHEIELVATKTVVAAVTLGTGVASYLDVIQGVLAIVASLAATILTSLLIYKEIRTIVVRARLHKRRQEDENI